MAFNAELGKYTTQPLDFSSSLKSNFELGRAMGEDTRAKILRDAATKSISKDGDFDSVAYRNHLKESGYSFTPEELNKANDYIVNLQDQIAKGAQSRQIASQLGATPQQFKTQTPDTPYSTGRDSLPSAGAGDALQSPNKGFSYLEKYEQVNKEKGLEKDGTAKEVSGTAYSPKGLEVSTNNPKELTNDKLSVATSDAKLKAMGERLSKMGPRNAFTALVQKSIGVKDDGTWGPKSQKALEKFPEANIEEVGGPVLKFEKYDVPTSMKERIKGWGASNEATLAIQKEIGMTDKQIAKSKGTYNTLTEAYLSKYLKAHPNAKLEATGPNVRLVDKGTGEVIRSLEGVKGEGEGEGKGALVAQTASKVSLEGTKPTQDNSMDVGKGEIRTRDRVPNNEIMTLPDIQEPNLGVNQHTLKGSPGEEDILKRALASQQENNYGIPSQGQYGTNGTPNIDISDLYVTPNTNAQIKTNLSNRLQQNYPGIKMDTDEAINKATSNLINNYVQSKLPTPPVFPILGSDINKNAELRTKYNQDVANYNNEYSKLIGDVKSKGTYNLFKEASDWDLGQRSQNNAETTTKMAIDKQEREFNGIDRATKNISSEKYNLDPFTFKDVKEVNDFGNKLGAYKHIIDTRDKPFSNLADISVFISQISKLEKLPENEHLAEVLFSGLANDDLKTAVLRVINAGGAVDAIRKALGSLGSEATNAILNDFNNKSTRQSLTQGLSGFEAELDSHRYKGTSGPEEGYNVNEPAGQTILKSEEAKPVSGARKEREEKSNAKKANAKKVEKKKEVLKW